jgi:two-component system, chemotaxis family, protein-glutamate methylesterase/glutaminase
MADAERTRDLVVVGASAGGVGTLRLLVAGLPRDLPAAVCIVLHTAPRGSSALASILQRAGELSCRAARDGDRLEPGRVLVAPPDHHLVIEDRHVRLTVGPRENGHRPSVDVLFRSAAEAGDGRVIGVVLSGTRDDGTAGLAMIKSRGGGTVVQDPEDALYAGMPASALAHVAVDAVVPADRLAIAVADMVRGATPPKPPTPQPPRTSKENAQGPLENTGVATVCPECGGVLDERSEAGTTQWRCRVGHRYSPESLADAQAQDVEAALWAAARVLEDRVGLLSRMADRAEARGERRSARSFRGRAESAGSHAELVRDALSQAASTTLLGLEAEEAGQDEETAA